MLLCPQGAGGFTDAVVSMAAPVGVMASSSTRTELKQSEADKEVVRPAVRCMSALKAC